LPAQAGEDDEDAAGTEDADDGQRFEKRDGANQGVVRSPGGKPVENLQQPGFHLFAVLGKSMISRRKWCFRESGSAAKLDMPKVENRNLFHPVAGESLPDPLDGTFTVVFRRTLGKEQVGVGDDPFLEGQWQHVAHRQGEFLRFDLGGAKPDPDVAVADQGMPGQSFLFEQFAALVAVAEVGKIAMTTDFGASVKSMPMSCSSAASWTKSISTPPAARRPAISLALAATRTLWRKRTRWASVPAG
jgi:hypothetical protein